MIHPSIVVFVELRYDSWTRAMIVDIHALEREFYIAHVMGHREQHT